MLTTILCPRCARFINHFSISICQTRFLSTTNSTLPASANDDDDVDTSQNMDRNVSRLPNDVYQHFKGKTINNHLLPIYISIGQVYHRLKLKNNIIHEQKYVHSGVNMAVKQV
jgi:hypothetical protein